MTENYTYGKWKKFYCCNSCRVLIRDFVDVLGGVCSECGGSILPSPRTVLTVSARSVYKPIGFLGIKKKVDTQVRCDFKNGTYEIYSYDDYRDAPFEVVLPVEKSEATL